MNYDDINEFNKTMQYLVDWTRTPLKRLVKFLTDNQKMSITKISKVTGLSRNTIYKYLEDAKNG